MAQDDVGLLVAREHVESLVVFLDEEVIEDGEVDQPSLVWFEFVVVDALSVDESQGFIEGVHDLVDLAVGGLLPFVDFDLFLRDAVLFVAHQLERDAAFVERSSRRFCWRLSSARRRACRLASLRATVALASIAVLTTSRTSVCSASLSHGRAWICSSFSSISCSLTYRAPARSCRRDAAEAGEVLVDVAELAAVTSVAVVAVAGAGELAAEVVVMLAAPRSGGALPGQDGLDALEAVGVDQRFVASRDGDSVSGDDAGVAVAGQQPVDAGATQGHGLAARCRASRESGVLKNLGDGADGVVAGQHQVEPHPHHRCTDRVDGDRGDSSSVDPVGDVEVAKSGRADGAAFLVLAVEAELDLLAVVSGAEGVDAAHDRELEHPFGGVVDALLGGFQLGAVGGDLPEQPERSRLADTGASTNAEQDEEEPARL